MEDQAHTKRHREEVVTNEEDLRSPKRALLDEEKDVVANAEENQIAPANNLKVVMCPLCPPSSQKRFKAGRSFQMHAKEVHLADMTFESEREKDEFLEKCFRDAVQMTLEIGDSTKGQQTRDWNKKARPHPEWVEAARKGNIDDLKNWMEQGVWCWSSKDRHGSTAEQYAAGAGQLDCVKFCVSLRHASCPQHVLLHSHFETESKAAACTCEQQLERRKDGRTSLHWAARNGEKNVIRYLVRQCKVDVNVKTFDGTTPLMYAVFGAHREACELLVQLGADPFHRNNWDCDLSHWIAMSKSTDRESVSSLCDWIQNNVGLDFCRPQKEGRTPLHKAAFVGNNGFLDWMFCSIEKILKKKVARVPDKTDRYPPLHMSLQRFGVFVNVKDNGGLTAHDLALKAGHRTLGDRLRVISELAINTAISDELK